jgi:hypothetical protein
MSSGMSFAYSGRSPQLRRRGAAHHEPISSAGIPRRATWIASQDDSVSTVSRQLQDYRGSPSTICGTHGCAQSWHKPEGDQRCGYHIIQDPSEAAARAACCVVRIWEPGATARWREPWRDGSGGRLKVTCAFETGEATRDGDRLARNPEVAGSNPVPATSGNAPRRLLRGRFHAACERFVNVSLAHRLVRLPSRPPRRNDAACSAASRSSFLSTWA